MKRIAGTLALAVVLAAAAGGPAAGRPGGASATFLRLPVGARAAAMGGAQTALAGDAFSSYFNPASLARVRAREVGFLENSYVLDLDQQVLLYRQPAWGGGAALSWNRFDLGRAPRTLLVTGTSYTEQGTFEAASHAWSFSYGWEPWDRLAVGLTGKVIREEIAEFDATAGAVDLGLLYRLPGDAIDLGLTVQNLGSDLTFVRESAPLPRLVRAGVAHRSFGGRLLVALDIEQAVDSDEIVRLGTEFWVTRAFALRLGLDSSSDAGDDVTAGFGWRRGGLSLDYAYANRDVLGGVHRVSLAYRWDADEGRAPTTAPASSSAATRMAAAANLLVEPRADLEPATVPPAPPAPASSPVTAAPSRPAAPRGPLVLVLDLRGTGGADRSDALSEALVARGYRTVRATGGAAARAGTRGGDPPAYVASGTVGPGGFVSLLLESVEDRRYRHTTVSGLEAPDAASFGRKAAEALAELIEEK